MNYYDWLASQYAYMYPDLYNTMLPLIEEELDKWGRDDLSPYQMDELVDSIMRRYNGLYPQALQRGYRDQNTVRNIILVLLLSRLFRRGSYPGYSRPFY
ncbi:hypothetical protein NSA47_04090 [Irregularibacter muris]|uniref:Uncharacterized protein n=1 Tax=Irregularibacter muris TaxID=1796619 RepID=A0AAE3HFG6_9FIRM|nr:hypothetical protein [Irregularibacter muris]MCR1898168.1 hypothetical protein [Irregularibacter muris]